MPIAIHQVASFNSLRHLPGNAALTVFVQHHSAEADQGGGRFEWDSRSTLADDNGTIAAPNERSAGRWVRQDPGPFNARWFGVRGQNVPGHDDLPALQSAVAAAKRLFGAPTRTGRHPQGGTIHLPRGTYYLSDTLTLPHGVSIIGEGSRVSRIVAQSGFPSGAPIVRLGEEPVQRGGNPHHAYHTMLRDVLVDGAGQDLIGVFGKSLQELSGLEYVTILDCGVAGARFTQPGEGVGSCQNFVLKDIEILVRNGRPDTEGLRLEGFADLRGVDGITVNGHGSNGRRIGAGIRLNKCYGIVVSRAHLEWCEDGVLIGEGSGNECRGVVVQGVTGGPEITNVVRISRGRSQGCVFMGITRQHANVTRLLRDQVNSRDFNDRELALYEM